MYFSGQPEPTGAIQCAIQYKPGSEDGDLIALFAHAIRALVAVVYKARTTDVVSGRPDANRWTSEFLLGYAILTVNEARSLLLLLGGGLNRHARIHGRSLWEHELHARRLVEEETNGLALKLRDAYAFEARVFGNLTDADPNAVERSIAHAIGVDDSALIRGDQERRVFGGDGRAAMKDEASPDKRYAGTVKWMGQVAHGSVLAINEIANATNGAKNDTFERAALDDRGDSLLWYCLWPLLRFVELVDERFDTGMPDFLSREQIVERANSINGRLSIVTAEQEAKAVQTLAEHARLKK